MADRIKKEKQPQRPSAREWRDAGAKSPDDFEVEERKQAEAAEGRDAQDPERARSRQGKNAKGDG